MCVNLCQLLPRSPPVLASSSECEFGRECPVCEAPLALPRLPADGPLEAKEHAYEWHVIEVDFLLVCALKVRSEPRAAPLHITILEKITMDVY